VAIGVVSLVHAGRTGAPIQLEQTERQGVLKPYSSSTEGIRMMTVDDRQDFDGEARVKEVRLRERPRYNRPRDIRQLIERNRPKF
jgi:hypothetical protein